MVTFTDIDPKDIDTTRLGRRGRVSYPIIKAFMERQSKVSKLDLSDLDKNPAYVRSVLSAYVKSHNMPIQIFSAGGDLHMMRLDLDNDNKPIPWIPGSKTTDGAPGMEQGMKAEPINATEVKKRSKVEKNKSNK